MKEIAAAKEADLKEGMMMAVQAGGRNIVLFRDREGKVSALEDRCSHADVRLSRGSFCGDHVECGAHGARFDVKTGKALCMPAVTGVKRFDVKVEGGSIFVVVP